LTVFVEEMPDRPISQHPNLVTEHGLTLIDAALDAARREYGEAQAAGDREALAKAGRDLRYWSVRRASAQVRSSPENSEAVQFGHVISILRENGRQQTFRIVGEDEADPAKGSISHVSPLARALLGKGIGDSIRAGNDQAEITAIDKRLLGRVLITHLEGLPTKSSELRYWGASFADRYKGFFTDMMRASEGSDRANSPS
jgi:transcription elongation GreA/GreB family factor